jgi:hypothetical protein
MHLQTQPSQFFTVFGSYILERQGDYLPVNSARPNSQNIRYPEKMRSVGALDQNINH